MRRRTWSRGERWLIGGTLLASLAIPAGFYLWPLVTKNSTTLQSSSDPLLCLAWAPDSRSLACGGGEKRSSSLSIWNAATHQLEHTFSAHSTPVTDVKFSPDGRYLASLSAHEACLWERASGDLKRKIALGFGLTMKWKGDSLIVKSFNPGTGKESQDTIEATMGAVTTKTRWDPEDTSETFRKQVSPGGQFFFQTVANPKGKDNRLEVRRVAKNLLLVGQPDHNFRRTWWRDATHLRAVAVLEGNHTILETRLWEFDCQTGRESWQTLETSSDLVQLSSDQCWLVFDVFSFQEGHKVRLFDLRRNLFVATWSSRSKIRTRSAFSPDSHFLAWLDGSAVHVERLEQFLSVR